MNEPVSVYRPAAATDGYGDPVDGTFALHETLVGRFAPSNPEETAEIGRNAVIRGGTVYARSATQPDIRATDRAVIRGVTYAIDGEVGLWRRSGEWGVQFAVKAVSDEVQGQVSPESGGTELESDS